MPEGAKGNASQTKSRPDIWTAFGHLNVMSVAIFAKAYLMKSISS